jgi:hypothetical protein
VWETLPGHQLTRPTTLELRDFVGSEL